MKTTDKTVTNPVIEALTKAFNENSGETTLETITNGLENKFAKYDVYHALQEMESQNKGCLIVGRRGHPTRFYWGQTAPVKQENKTQHSPANLLFRVRLGNIEKTFPLVFELKPA